MNFEPAERERLNKVILAAGFSVDDFDLELIQVNDEVRPDRSYVPKKVYKVTRKTNGKSRNYATGAGSVWPDDVEKDLEDGEFGEP